MQVTPLHQCSYLPDRAARLELFDLSNHERLTTPLFSGLSRVWGFAVVGSTYIALLVTTANAVLLRGYW